jgi:hypothetical protein
MTAGIVDSDEVWQDGTMRLEKREGKKKGGMGNPIPPIVCSSLPADRTYSAKSFFACFAKRSFTEL